MLHQEPLQSSWSENMTYLAVRRDALEEVISERQLQSTDFDLGLNFVGALQSKQALKVNGRLEVLSASHGSICIGPNANEDHYIVFDLDQIRASGQDVDSSTLLLILQKTLRFAIRYWTSSVLNKSETINSNSNLGIVFPFPISRQTNLRVVIDLSPDAERMARRGRNGRYLLAFKFAADESGANEGAGLAGFRRFLADIDTLRCDQMAASADQTEVQRISAFSGTTVDEVQNKVDPHQNYDTWMHFLTKDQFAFVTAPLVTPRRIDGPAGSGKTISLSLAAIHAMRAAAEQGAPYDALFVTHSEASRRAIETILRSMDSELYLGDQPALRRLQVVTLQGYCASLLRQDLSNTEFVDPDAYDAKQLQNMYVEEAIRRAEKEWTTYSRFLSTEFKDYVESESIELKATLLQHEIAVVIKGRSKENLDVYRKVPPLASGLPIRNESDKGFVWRIYEEYRRQLVQGGQFDTDDVVLTALSQLATPIWRRRRVRDGFDALFIDETHLFNMNELSVFHHLTKSDSTYPIAFAVDRSQAIGDRGWQHDIDVSTLLPHSEGSGPSRTNLQSIFRSSPDIVNLAFSITSSGASLFTNFDDPLKLAHSGMSFEEEKRAKMPVYREVANDVSMVSEAFVVADRMKEEVGSTRGDIAIIAADEILFNELVRFGGEANKPFEVLKERGDQEVARRARETGRYVISMPDYVGGLEFDGVVLVGVDEGRMPPYSSSSRAESKAYVNYAAHNRLYVAISRARYQVAMLGSAERGSSPILSAAFASGTLLKAA
jgi:hypothetical protein